MATVAKSVAMNAFGGQQKIGDGNKTQIVYSMIREKKYDEVIKVLEDELQNHPRERAALSLLGYCYYFKQDFEKAAETYEKLTRFHPTVEEYKVYHAQSLLKANFYEEAIKVAKTVNDRSPHAYRMLHLQTAVQYELDNLQACKAFVDRCNPSDADSMVAYAAITYKEGEFEAAKNKFAEAMNTLGYQPDLAYNIALCFYKMQEFSQALNYITEIIHRGGNNHPDLSVGCNTGDIKVRSVGNSQTLQETALVQAFNLKAAIEYQLKNYENAREALMEMPPRNEEELDPVTLHNQALMNMDATLNGGPADSQGGFRKLNYLLHLREFPPETFGNLLLLYIQNSFYDLAADVLEEHLHLHDMCLSQELYDYLEASILTIASPEEAYRKFDILANKHIEILRRLMKNMQDSRLVRDKVLIPIAMQEYDEGLERYIPVLMAQARIYWEIENYSKVETILKQAGEFCSDHDIWRLNVAHVLFMGGRYNEAISFYENSIKKNTTSILDITPGVLANLCVSHIMMSQNSDATELMQQIEKEEGRRQLEQDPYENRGQEVASNSFIVNLVIGTLYCAKGKYSFGVGRIIKSFEPSIKNKLSADAWFHAKRCFLALIEQLAKHMLVFTDDDYFKLIEFLDEAELHGKDVITKISNQQGQVVNKHLHNVSAEARLLKKMVFRLRD